jgi:hypothetical protein
MVIKADQFPTWHQSLVDKTFGMGMFVKVLTNMRSLETITEWGEKLRRQHRPANQLTLPPFMESALVRAAQPPVTPVVANLNPVSMPPNIPPQRAGEPPSSTGLGAVHPLTKKLICVTCGEKISYPEGKFCWNNAKRFGGLQYCREHQAAF